MRSARAAALCARVAAGAILVATALAEEPDFFVRLNQAREAVSVGAGKKYFDGPFSKAFYARQPARLTLCMKTTGEDEPTGFDMLVRLARGGRVESVMVNPESRVAACYRDLTKTDVFPPPPSDRFWVPVSVRISEE